MFDLYLTYMWAFFHPKNVTILLENQFQVSFPTVHLGAIKP